MCPLKPAVRADALARSNQCPDLETQVVAVVHLVENLLDEGIRVTQLRVGSPQPRIQALPGGEPDQELLDVAPLRGVPS